MKQQMTGNLVIRWSAPGPVGGVGGERRGATLRKYCRFWRQAVSQAHPIKNLVL